jgi:hypothetical protein
MRIRPTGDASYVSAGVSRTIATWGDLSWQTPQNEGGCRISPDPIQSQKHHAQRELRLKECRPNGRGLLSERTGICLERRESHRKVGERSLGEAGSDLARGDEPLRLSPFTRLCWRADKQAAEPRRCDAAVRVPFPLTFG